MSEFSRVAERPTEDGKVHLGEIEDISTEELSDRATSGAMEALAAIGVTQTVELREPFGSELAVPVEASDESQDLSTFTHHGEDRD